MRKNIFGRRLKRDKNERKALFKNLLSSLVLNDRIETTEAKAKAIKSDADKLITKARKEGLLAKKLLEQSLNPEAIEKLVKDVAPRFAKRQGGYTRIIKLGKRFGDDAPMVILEWTEKQVIIETPREISKPSKRTVTKKTASSKKVKKEAKPKKTATKKKITAKK